MADYEKVYQIKFNTTAAQAAVTRLEKGLDRIEIASSRVSAVVSKGIGTAGAVSMTRFNTGLKKVEGTANGVHKSMLRIEREAERASRTMAREIERANKRAEIGQRKLEAAALRTAQAHRLAAERIKAAFVNVGRTLTWYVTLPLVGAAGAAIKFAADAEKTAARVGVVFGDSTKYVTDFAQTALDKFGMAGDTALNMAASFGDFAESLGFSKQKSAELSVNLVKLAGDLASFKNVSFEEAQTALTSVMTGQGRPLRRLGIIMNDANLKQFAKEQGVKKQYSAMSAVEKAQLRYNFVLAKSIKAVGDYERNSGKAANQMRSFGERVHDLAETFGKRLLPVFAKVLKFLADISDKFSKLSESTQELIIGVAGLAAALGPLLYVGGSIVIMLGKLKKALIAITSLIVLNPWTVLLYAAIAAIGITILNWNMLVAEWEKGFTQISIWLHEFWKFWVQINGEIGANFRTLLLNIQIWFMEFKKFGFQVITDVVGFWVEKFNTVLSFFGRTPIKLDLGIDTASIDAKIAQLEREKGKVTNEMDTSSIDREIASLNERKNSIDVGKAMSKDITFFPETPEAPMRGAGKPEKEKPAVVRSGVPWWARKSRDKEQVNLKNVVDLQLAKLAKQGGGGTTVNMGSTSVTVNGAGGDPRETARAIRAELDKRDRKNAEQIRRATRSVAAFEQ